MSKLFIGAALLTSNESAIGQRGPPSPQLLAAGRRSAALAGVLGSLAFLAIARRVLGFSAGLVSALLLVTSPTWLTTSRHALADIHAVALRKAASGTGTLTTARVSSPSRSWRGSCCCRAASRPGQCCRPSRPSPGVDAIRSELLAQLAEHRRVATPPEAIELGEEELERLRSLGYER